MVENSQRNNIIEIHRSTLLHNTVESSKKGAARWTTMGCVLPKTTWKPCATCSRGVTPIWDLMDL